MHGEGRNRMRSIRMAVGALAAALVLASAAQGQFGPAGVYLEPVEKRTVRRAVELVGTAGARRRSVVSAEVAGRIEKMFVDAGDYVEAGRPLCQMRRLPVEFQLRRAQGLLDAARADLRKFEQGYRKEEIDQAEARAKASRATLEKWTQDHVRTVRLLADGASTQAEMDSVEASFRQAREKLAEDEAYLALVRSGYRIEDIDQARAQVATQTAAVEELGDTLTKTTVAMPFNGFVVRKACEVGEWLVPGGTVAEVIDLDVVRVQLDVPERHLPGLAKGAKAPVVFEALGTDREFAGEVSQIVPASAAGTHTVTVRVDVPNEIAAGRPTIAAGLFARVRLPVGEEHEAMLVPKDALIRQEGRDLVYTVSDAPPPDAKPKKPEKPKTAEEKQQAEAVAQNAALIAQTLEKAGAASPPIRYAVAIPVRIIGGLGRYMEVESDALKAGMPLVTRGTYLMSHGAEVQVRPKEAVPAGVAVPGAAGRAGDAP